MNAPQANAQDMRREALKHALEFHGSCYGPDIANPTAADIIATAQKFSGFLLVEKKTQQPRAKRA